MNKETGELTELTDEEYKKLEEQFKQGLQTSLIPIPGSDIKAVRSMPTPERLAYARQVQKTRNQNKAARKARRKNRK